MSRLHETAVEVEVPFHDVDPLGVVWHGHYFKYMELARSRMLGGLGLDGEELLATGHRFYVIESRCRHVYPLRYRDRVQVTAWIKEYENRIFIAFDLWNTTAGRRCARAHTILATTDARGLLLMETPPILLERLFACERVSSQ